MTIDSIDTSDTSARHDYDLIIVGGGPVGMALALALRGSGVSVLLLEARGLPGKTEDSRPLALSHGSRLILQRLGVWQGLPEVTPITTIHISNRGGFGRTILNAADMGVPALGYVLNHHDVFRAMHKALRNSGTTYLTGARVVRLETHAEAASVEFEHEGQTKTASAGLLALADGGRLIDQIEGVTQHVQDYEQWAVVARVKSEHLPAFAVASPRDPTHAAAGDEPGLKRAKGAPRPGTRIHLHPQPGVAYERFTPDGPVALLPSGEYFALVWTVSPSLAQEILGLDDAVFLMRLHMHFGDRLGRFIETGKRAGFPLALKYASPVTACRSVLIGNAAQTLHPVAGQGFNLGLRDAWELADEIIASPLSPLEAGTSVMLARYREKRRVDGNVGRIFTDSLVKLFSNDDPLLSSMRSLGLSALDCLPQAKRFVARRMMFGARG